MDLNNRRILITGGTGSFGGAVLQSLIASGVKEIRVFSRDEKKQHDLRIKYPNSPITYFLGDVRSIKSVTNAMRNIDYVFHAAALKQVPSCEFFPLEAVNTNILGTENVIEAGLIEGVKKIVVLSTDKACYPINAMGISKAMMEKIAIANARNLEFSGSKNTVICITRYGNVMASRGSVIPLWNECARNGADLNVTNYNMTRYMMTLEDAVNLVLYAFLNGSNGDIYVQKAPAVKLAVLAESIIELNRSPSESKEIGIRHGEKNYETLVTKEEMNRAIDLGEYFCIPMDSRELNYNKFFSEGDSDYDSLDEYNSNNGYLMNKTEMKAMLLKLDIFNE